MIRVKQCSSFDELEQYAPIWNDLLQKSRDNDVMSTWEWISCWWQHFGKHRELRVLVAEENGKIMAIAPLMLSKYKFMKLGTMTKIEFIGTPQSDYNNFIWLENEEKCLDLFLEHLVDQRDWDCLELFNVHEGTLSAKLLCESDAALSRKLENRVLTLCPYLELPSSIEEYTKKLPSGIGKEARRAMRRLQEEYRVGFKTQADFCSVQEAMDSLFDLHQRRWKLKGETGDFATPSVRKFHLDLANNFDRKGWLALSFLTANEEPVASTYSFDYRGKRYFYQSGFDPRFARYSVGTLLHLQNVNVCIAKEFKEYDFTRGVEPYKLRLSTQVRKSLAIQLVRGGWFTKTARWVVKSGILPAGLLNKLRQRSVPDSGQ
jgi:CelD/BcsL family acetyltransferase involved in cellulose biosynthesis